MRLILPLSGLMFLTAFGVAEAKPYSNAKYGFSLDVLPAISTGWEEPDAGDGVRSHSADGNADLVAWAGFLLDENGEIVKFAAEMRDRIKSEAGSGAKVTYQKIDAKGWAAFSSVNGETILYERAILACKGGAIASYRLQYPKARKAEFDPIIKALNGSFMDNGGCKLKN